MAPHEWIQYKEDKIFEKNKYYFQDIGRDFQNRLFWKQSLLFAVKDFHKFSTEQITEKKGELWKWSLL